MASVNISTRANESTFEENIFSNNNSDLAKNTATPQVDYSSTTVLVVCALGLPGNLLVIAVYVAKMTTSTRVYLFALAVADTSICVGGIVLTASLTNVFTQMIIILITSLAINYSVVLLTFVSVERFLAVRRPHSFTMNPRRAKTALIIIALYVIVFTALQGALVAFTGRMIFHAISQFCFVFCSTTVMIICYTLMAYELLKKKRHSRRKVGVHNVAYLAEPGGSKVTSASNDTALRGNRGPSTVSAVTENIKTAATKSAVPKTTNTLAKKKAKNVKSVFLLIVITVVFVVCWLPSWLRTVIVSIPVDVTPVFVLNSVVNPFIYGVASGMFREDVRLFYRKTRVKLTACYQ